MVSDNKQSKMMIDLQNWIWYKCQLCFSMISKEAYWSAADDYWYRSPRIFFCLQLIDIKTSNILKSKIRDCLFFHHASFQLVSIVLSHVSEALLSVLHFLFAISSTIVIIFPFCSIWNMIFFAKFSLRGIAQFRNLLRAICLYRVTREGPWNCIRWTINTIISNRKFTREWIKLWIGISLCAT